MIPVGPGVRTPSALPSSPDVRTILYRASVQVVGDQRARHL